MRRKNFIYMIKGKYDQGAIARHGITVFSDGVSLVINCALSQQLRLIIISHTSSAIHFYCRDPSLTCGPKDAIQVLTSGPFMTTDVANNAKNKQL